jgi:hypothetical protein
LALCITANPHQVMFSYWEMVLSIEIAKNNPLLLCHQQKFNIWHIHKQQSKTMWLSSLFGNIGVSQMKPIVIYDDNQSYISLSNNPIFHVCTKHIKIHHHVMWKKTKKNFVKLVYHNTKNMVVDILIKELYANRNEYLWHLISVNRCVTW